MHHYHYKYNPNRISGVYAIVCTPTGEKYVGSSKDVYDRIKCHIRKLGRRIHVNPKLQAAYTANGRKFFKFYLLADVPDVDTRFDAEQFFIDTGAFSLNIGTNARACLGTARSQRPEGLLPFSPKGLTPRRVDPWA